MTAIYHKSDNSMHEEDQIVGITIEETKRMEELGWIKEGRIIPCSNPHSWEDGKGYQEGKDYKLESPDAEWEGFYDYGGPYTKGAISLVAVPIEPSNDEDELKPKIVCFCGSTRFAESFMVKRWELEKQGIITLGINILPNNYFAEGNSHGAEQEGVKEILDELHKRKIDLADEVFILNVGGYIGESTRSELEYAISKNKPITYLEPIHPKQK